eukprot:TRINITY_DN93204_c0_g1_i1.p1 TRINITY_DN93204_c0_g1~~TRINITY_DN93204_c0_g1_i1.p1  ORF type:complete len:251 (-),score=24.62 TRINITY_DN93204_c0_g1_i1:139-891(-)
MSLGAQEVTHQRLRSRALLLVGVAVPLLTLVRNFSEYAFTTLPSGQLGSGMISGGTSGGIAVGSGLSVLRAPSFAEENYDIDEPEFDDGSDAPLFNGGQLGSPSSAVSPATEMAVTSRGSRKSTQRPRHSEIRDRGFQVGEAAYQHPPPIPDPFSVEVTHNQWEGECEAEYHACWKVCSRYTTKWCAGSRMRQDCQYDCFRKRRTCHWKIRPIKMHPKYWKYFPGLSKGRPRGPRKFHNGIIGTPHLRKV